MAIISISLSTFIGIDTFNQFGKKQLSTFSKWEKFQNDNEGRGIATKISPMECQGNILSTDNIKSEIAKLEQKFETGHYIDGNWYGIKLKSLPSIQAQFLADYGNYIGDLSTSQNYAECPDVPCVINKVYKNQSTKIGYLAYYWYLKTGSMLSVSNKIPGQSEQYPGSYAGKKHDFKDYLFSLDELEKLYFLAKSLPEQFLHNPLMKSIHKIPNNSSIEGYNATQCAVSRRAGHILINQTCLGDETSDSLFINLTNQMVKYVDKYKGYKQKTNSISSSKNWEQRSLWLKEEFYDVADNTYFRKWYSHLPKTKFVSEHAKLSPAEQLSQLVSYYRFEPQSFISNTPVDLYEYIKKEFFNNKSYTAGGLYNQYLTQAITQWSKEESHIWDECYDQFLNKTDYKNLNERDLASQMESPLFSCVEKTVPYFMNQVIDQIKSNQYEGCKFFNNEQEYGHVSNKFYKTLNKYLQEKIIKRKIEFQSNGNEVLIGRELKHRFIQTLDPSSVYINCFSRLDSQLCYDQKISSHINSLFSQNTTLSEYYKNIIKEDITSVFSYQQSKGKTNQITKKFISPYYSKIHFSAQDIWTHCKEKGISHAMSFKLPLEFTGGKNFINAKHLNCINENIKVELDKIVDLGAFQTLDNQTIQYKLNKNEKKFAITFMHGKFIQELNNILEKDIVSESRVLDQHFELAQSQIIKDFLHSDILEDAYSLNQVHNKCLQEINNYYPSEYFYHSKADVDKKYGRTICSTFISDPKTKNDIGLKMGEKWMANKKLAKNILIDHFEKFVIICNQTYSLKLGPEYRKNAKLRSVCIEDSFKQAHVMAMAQWKSHQQFEYFSTRESEIQNHLFSFRTEKLEKAIDNKETI